MSSSSGIAVSVLESAWSWSPGPPCPQLCRALSVMPARSHSARADGCSPPVEERFGSRVSICAEAIPPTSADWRQCLLRTEAFELRLRAVAHPLSRQEGDSECPVVAVPRFHFCDTRVCDQMPPVPRLRELPQQWRRHKRPGRRHVRGQQRW